MFLESLGCAGNRVDGSRVLRLFEGAGWAVTDDASVADIVIVQTCGFTRFQEERTVGRLVELTRTMRKDARLLVGGCLPSISPERVARFAPAGTFGPRSLDRAAAFAGKGASVEAIPAFAASMEETGVATVRVATGCLDRCGYCAIPFANGRIRSRGIPDIERDILAALRRGFDVVHLVGEDIGAWGRDQGSSLLDLLTHLLALPVPVRFQVDNLNPNWLVQAGPDLYDALVSPRVLPRYYVPAQSGSDEVLARMRRRYTADDVRAVVSELRRRRPGASFSTDFIVGFPGESEADFELSRRLLLDMQPDFASIYSYQDRARTEGALLEPKVPVAERERRARSLIAEMIMIHATRVGMEDADEFVRRLRAGERLPINTNVNVHMGEAHAVTG